MIHQLAFDFTFPFEPSKRPQVNHPWRVASLARRYRLPEAHAAIYAAEMHLPGRGDSQ